MKTGWNCRLVEYNGEAKELPWTSVEAYDQEKAAEAYCHETQVWDRVSWSEDDEAVVEVELHGGENGVQRMRVNAYTELAFGAELDG